MVEIRKQKENSYFLKIKEANFLINPERLVEGTYIILTKNDLSLNRGTIFQAPGEYEIRRVYLTVFPGQTFLFQTQDFDLLFAENLPSKFVIESLKKCTNKIPIVFISKLSSILPWYKEFETNIFVTESELKASGFVNEKVKSIKINIRRLNHIIYWLA